MDEAGAARIGRPRSEQARTAVLHAVDDLLLEVGYAEMTIKGIAERAGVGRQTVYRWWSTKAEILFEASVIDARQELALRPGGDPVGDLAAYVESVMHFLTSSPAGAAYRALLGEAQHDAAVAGLLAGTDVLAESTRAAITTALGRQPRPTTLERAVDLLVGPAFYAALRGRAPDRRLARDVAETVAGYLAR